MQTLPDDTNATSLQERFTVLSKHRERKTTSLQVRRQATFVDAFLQAQSCDLLQCVRGGCVLSAGFVDAVGPSLSSLEAGSSGYGPRKEFFLLAGQAIVQQGSGALLLQPSLGHASKRRH